MSSSSAVVSTGPNSSVQLNRPGTEVFSKVTDGGVDYNFFDVIDGMAHALLGTAKQETVSKKYTTSSTALNSGAAFNLTVSVGKTNSDDGSENSENQETLYFKIPVDYEIMGNFLGYLKFRRALAGSSKVINFDKEEINVLKEVQGQVLSKGTISIVGLPNEYK